MVQKFLSVVAAAAFVAAGPPAPALAAGSIESVSLSRSSGFVRNEASFKEVGAGSSKVAVWIEVYDGPDGPLKETLGRKSGTSACREGRTCFSNLRTSAPALSGECYVGWASIASGGDTSRKRSPSGSRLCP